MLLPNNPEIKVEPLNEKLNSIAEHRRREMPLFANPDPDVGPAPDGAFASLELPATGFSLRRFVAGLPVIGRLAVNLYLRLRGILAPGLHWQQRVRLIPVVGAVGAWAFALARLATTAQKTEAELARLRQTDEAVKDVLAQMNARLQRFDEIDIAARLQRFDEIDIAARLQRFDQIDIAARLQRFDQIDIAARLERFDQIDIAARLQRLDQIDIAARLQRFDEIDIAARLQRFDQIDIAARLQRFDEIDIAARLQRFDQIDIAARLQRFDEIDIAARLQRFDEIDIAARLQRFDQIDIAARLDRLDQFAGTTSSATMTLDNRIAGITRELRRQPKASDTEAPAPPVQARLPIENTASDSFYIDFEDAFRGPREDITERLKVYLPYLDRFLGDDSAQVVDIGCGRGEWLALLGQRGLRAIGIDLDAAMVDACQELALPAQCADALDYLRSQAEGSLAAVTGFHLIEHLPFKTLLALLDAALRALRSDGLIIFETPNPENLSVGACNFHSDPTHLKPIVPLVAQFMARQRGFAQAEILRLHPYPESHRVPEDSELAKRFNDALYGPQDYALLAWKTHAI